MALDSCPKKCLALALAALLCLNVFQACQYFEGRKSRVSIGHLFLRTVTSNELHSGADNDESDYRLALRQSQ